MKRFLHLLFMPCEGNARLASESLDRNLDAAERFALRLHTLYCSACRRYRRQIHRIRHVLRQPTTPATDALTHPDHLKLSPKAREEITRIVNQSHDA